MAQIMTNFIDAFKDEFVALTNNENNFDTLLNAYNTYCNEENGGANYIFDMDNKKDLICLIDGGMTTKDIIDIVDRQKAKYVILNQNQNYVPLRKDEIVKCFRAYCYEITETIITFPYIEEYKNVYQIVIEKLRN